MAIGAFDGAKMKLLLDVMPHHFDIT